MERWLGSKAQSFGLSDNKIWAQWCVLGGLWHVNWQINSNSGCCSSTYGLKCSLVDLYVIPWEELTWHCLA